MLARRVPRYETISYIWGDAAKRASSHLDGLVLDVPHSAHEAVARTCLPDKIRTLWIDAICINKSNLEERTAQIAMMGSIYRNTCLNLIWFGPGSATNAKAFADLELMSVEVDERFGSYVRLQPVLYDRSSGHWKDDTIGLPKDISIGPIEEIYQNTWFERLWVLQEAVLPPCSLYLCGSHPIPLLSLNKGATMLYHKRAFFRREFTGSFLYVIFRATKLHLSVEDCSRRAAW
jgi:hypothetical protein